MKGIIYNTKLKKKLIVMLLFMLLFNFLFSCTSTIVYADTEESANEAGVTREMFYPKKDDKIVSPEEFDEYFGEGTENSTNWKYDKWNIELGDIMKEHEGKPYASYASAGASKFNASLKESYESNKTNTEKITLKEAYIKAVDAAMATSVEIKENAEKLAAENEDSADLGGILLSPVFYLINFIADAVINILGSLMMPEVGFDLGMGVLTNTPPSTQYENTYSQYVDVKSFIPTNFIGGLVAGGELAYQYPNLPYTPEEIFSGKIELLSIDFISGKTSDGDDIQDENWLNIRKVISQWYQILRMIAIIGLLSVLIYTGIKILISANAKDKAQYKQWIMNWIMAVAILFFMHIIMAFIVAITGEFSKLMSEACQGINVQLSDGNGFVTNLMGLVRFMIQSENFFIKVGYEVMYIALIWYTIKFTFLYLKRVLNMAFLTLIAPIVALTYPIDKINDGKAQGFDMWIKEYIFNALLQPMHCVLYYVLVGSAVGIAASNPIYGIVVLAFMSEAERLLKKIFGFDKAGKTNTTNGGVVSAFAAGAIASNIGKIAKMASGGGGKGTSGGNAGKEQSLFDNLKAIDTKSHDELFTDGGGLPSGGPSSSDAYQNSNNPVADAEREALEEKLSDGQITPDELTDTQRRLLGLNTQSSSSADTGEPIKEKSKFAKGASAVGKRLLKPVWDLEHGGAYNGKRLARNIGKAAVGFSLGTAAAAVQAGISITDGKYNPAEGIAAFAAGYAGGGQVTKGFASLIDTYNEGTLSDNPETRKKELMERAQAKFSERDDVIKHNKKYAQEDRDTVVGIQKQLLEQGVTDLKDMDSCIKYIKKSNGGKLDGYSPDLVKKARVMQDFANDKSVQSVRFDPDKKKKYIESAGKDENARRVLSKKFEELEIYMDANKK